MTICIPEIIPQTSFYSQSLNLKLSFISFVQCNSFVLLSAIPKDIAFKFGHLADVLSKATYK